MTQSVRDAQLKSTGYEQKTAFNAAAEAMDTTKINDAHYLLLQAEGGDVRWRDDGVAPTTTVGMLIAEGQDFWFTGDVKRLSVIGVDGAAILNASGYK
jgi:hypothetical protein